MFLDPPQNKAESLELAMATCLALAARNIAIECNEQRGLVAQLPGFPVPAVVRAENTHPRHPEVSALSETRMPRSIDSDAHKISSRVMCVAFNGL